MQALDRDHRVSVVPFQRPGVAADNGLTIAQCEAAAWTITPDGRQRSGASAIAMVLAVALQTRIPLIVYAIPGLRHLQNAGYAWIARNRYHLPGVRPHCEEYPDDCR